LKKSGVLFKNYSNYSLVKVKQTKTPIPNIDTSIRKVYRNKKLKSSTKFSENYCILLPCEGELAQQCLRGENTL